MTRSQIGLTLIALATLSTGMYYAGKNSAIQATKPYRSICFQDDSKELKHFTPAYWVERDGMRNMDWEKVTLKCRGDVGGFMMDWESDQFWLRRQGASKVTTR